jgi:hypothetical protein
MADLQAQADALCEALCQTAIQEGMDMMLGMCGNAGQEAIIGNAEGDWADACMACADGTGGSFSTNHDEAVGVIADAGNALLDELATRCAQIQDAALAGVDGDGSPGDGDGDDDGMGGDAAINEDGSVEED